MFSKIRIGEDTACGIVMSGKSEDRYLLVVSKLEKKHKELTAYRQDNSWRFAQGEAPEAYERSFDDSAWEIVSLPKNVDARKGMLGSEPES